MRLVTLLPALGATVCFALSLLGCPPQQKVDAREAPCTKFGATCTFSPGKLGTCVAVENCPVTASESCLMCQSQH